MKISCYIVDDQPHVIDMLSYYVRGTEGLELIGSERNPICAINKIFSGVVQPDILFLDIDMPDMDGLELSRQVGDRAVVIFITGHSEHALEAFDIGAADYLLKPPSMNSFLRAVDRAKERLKQRQPPELLSDFIFVRLDSRNLTKVQLNDIERITVNDKYVYLFLVGNKKPLIINNSLNHIEAALPAHLFVRIQKSCMVNLTHVQSVVANRVIMNDGTIVEVARRFLQNFYARLNAI
ncbi:LytTR family DNA-binding domain-containing protein [Niabella sp. CC-SYL272]|uniref:LytR/AlgR family response regulator transcription factor n=1 Tax=Niabella agricola TaxID=2891571 RepID=UPI001F2E094C|nr:LytTR family DNA-binding domain-containing protein [Niabella agricola]MCF3109614.1 LytTR family DNA-binding domain-containing protein [Niabella agricola]